MNAIQGKRWITAQGGLAGLAGALALCSFAVTAAAGSGSDDPAGRSGGAGTDAIRQPSSRVAPKETAKLPRLRISAWAGLPISHEYLGKPAYRKDGYLADPAKRAVIGKNLVGAKGFIDDISLIRTVGLLAKNQAGWDPNFLPGLPKERKRYCRDVIELAHAKGIQVLAGYAIADEGYAKGAQGHNDPLRRFQGAPSSAK